MGVFGTPQRVLVRGEGCYVWDADGKRVPGPARRHRGQRARPRPPVPDRRDLRQLATLGHVSNFFTSPPRSRWPSGCWSWPGARPGSKVFFANSGTEANEAAFKLARAQHDGRAADRILALEGAFHGRTMGALALTCKQAYREPFEPLPGGVDAPPLRGRRRPARPPSTRPWPRVVLEPIQGEAGVRRCPAGYLRLARELTTRSRRAADPRRGADRHRPHRQVVRASRRPAGDPRRRDDAGQGTRRRLPDRRADHLRRRTIRRC